MRIDDSITITGAAPQPVGVGNNVTVSVRPEKARLCDAHPGSAANVFPVDIDRVAYIGADTRIFVRLGAEHRFTVWEANTSAAPVDAHRTTGRPAFLTWPVENALVLAE